MLVYGASTLCSLGWQVAAEVLSGDVRRVLSRESVWVEMPGENLIL